MANFEFWNRKHTAAQALSSVHEVMKQKIKIDDDVQQAAQMQAYLQYFKKIFYQPGQYATKDKMLSALGLEEQAITVMRERFQQVLGVTNKYNQIFRSEHEWYKHRKDFDDIAEGELNALLQVMAETATGIKDINLGQKIVGSQNAIVDIKKLEKNTVQLLTNNISEKISSKQVSQIIENISVGARSGKVDNVGYSESLVLTANIKSEFENFINLFTAKNFSVKNYKGNTEYNIHLGSTVPVKAMYASLRYLGYDQDAAVHIYSHSMASYKKNPNIIKRNKDIFHLRFLYELTGAGLIDADTKQPLSAVDFLIYNDPTSEKIYVKSTKKLINDILSSNVKITNPWKGVYISKLKLY